VVRTCASCRRPIEDDFRFCPGCGTPQRVKVVEHFLGAEEVDDGGLRVSAYLTRPQHVRFSIWKGDRAQAALSLHPAEAQRLADFLHGLARHANRSHLPASLHTSAAALRATIDDLVRPSRR
jgi:hypothetical protein